MTDAELDSLLDEIDELHDCPAKLALLHRAVAAADAMQNIELAYALRQDLIGTALEIGKGDQLAVAFSWCLSKFDENPHHFPDDEAEILWRFRWVISELSGYYQVPKPQLIALVKDMTRRYRKAGVSLRAVYLLRLNVGHVLYTKRTTKTLLQQFHDAPRDTFSDDPEQELMFEVLHHLYDDREQQAIELGRPFLNGAIQDDHDKITIRSAFTVPLLLNGETEQAMRCHETTASFVLANPRHVDLVADHMNFLTLTDNAKESLKLFARSLGNAMEWSDPWNRMIFLAAATFLFERLSKSGDKPVKLRLPESFPHRREKGSYVPSELAKLLRADLRFLVDAFNERNGNTYESRLFNNIAKYHKNITPLKMASTK